MLQIKNTIDCPACGTTLRVRAIVVSDGNDFEYYLCPTCEDVVRRDPGGGGWKLRGERAEGMGGIVKSLQALAADDWQARATSRAPRTCRIPELGKGRGSAPTRA